MTQYTKRRNRVQYLAYSQKSEPVDDNWYEKTPGNLGKDGENLIPVETENLIPNEPVPKISDSQPPTIETPTIETPTTTNKPVVSKPNVVKPKPISTKLPEVEVNKKTVVPIKKEKEKENGTFTIQRLILLAILCVALYYGFKYIDKHKLKSSFGKYSYDISRAYDMVR